MFFRKEPSYCDSSKEVNGIVKQIVLTYVEQMLNEEELFKNNYYAENKIACTNILASIKNWAADQEGNYRFGDTHYFVIYMMIQLTYEQNRGIKTQWTEEEVIESFFENFHFLND